MIKSKKVVKKIFEQKGKVLDVSFYEDIISVVTEENHLFHNYVLNQNPTVNIEHGIVKVNCNFTCFGLERFFDSNLVFTIDEYKEFFMK